MSAASGARSLRAIDATASVIEARGRSGSSSTARRDTATELITLSEPGCEATIATTARARSLRADLKIDRSCERVGDRRPLLDVGHQRVDLALRDALAFHVDLDPHVGEADRLLADVAGSPHRRDVEIALELKLELVDDPSAMHGIGVQSHGEAGTKRGERGLRRIG